MKKCSQFHWGMEPFQFVVTKSVYHDYGGQQSIVGALGNHGAFDGLVVARASFRDSFRHF